MSLIKKKRKTEFLTVYNMMHKKVRTVLVDEGTKLFVQNDFCSFPTT